MAERIAGSLRRRARLRVREPPWLAADRLGYRVRVEYLGRGVRGHSENGSNVIRLAPQPWEPSMAFVFAHELMELATPRHYCGRLRERVCQRGSAAFLLPARAFRYTLFRALWDIPTLRRWWPWASWEALGFRVSDLFPWAAFSTWSDDRFRRSGGTTPSELEVAACLQAQGARPTLLASEGAVVRAWPVTEPGVRRKVVALKVPATIEQVEWARKRSL